MGLFSKENGPMRGNGGDIVPRDYGKCLQI